MLPERFPQSTFFGYDLCAEAIASGQADAQRLHNLTLEQKDIADFSEEEEAFDVIFTFSRNE